MTPKKQKDAAAPKAKATTRTTKHSQSQSVQTHSEKVATKNNRENISSSEKTIIAEIKPIMVSSEKSEKHVRITESSQVSGHSASHMSPTQDRQAVQENGSVNISVSSGTQTGPATPHDTAFKLMLDLSQSLGKKLKEVARQEGISVESFVRELIAEGLLLRAFEIADRKNNMRQGNHSQNQNSQGNSYNHRGNNNQGSHYRGSQGNNARGGQPNHRGGNNSNRRNVNIHNLLEDKASFIEYVRSQEKKRR